MSPVQARRQIRQSQIQLARRTIAGDQQPGFARFQNAVVEVKDRHFPRLIPRHAFDVIDADQGEMFHPLQHVRDKPGSFIQRHVAYRITARRKLRTGGMQQVAAPRTFA